MISGWSHVIHGVYKPWGTDSLTYHLQHVSLFVTTFVFVMGLLFKVEGVTETSPSYRALTIIMLLLCLSFGVLWVAALGHGVMLTVRRKRQQKALKMLAGASEDGALTASGTPVAAGSSRRLPAPLQSLVARLTKKPSSPELAKAGPPSGGDGSWQEDKSVASQQPPAGAGSGSPFPVSTSAYMSSLSFGAGVALGSAPRLSAAAMSTDTAAAGSASAAVAGGGDSELSALPGSTGVSREAPEPGVKPQEAQEGFSPFVANPLHAMKARTRSSAEGREGMAVPATVLHAVGRMGHRATRGSQVTTVRWTHASPAEAGSAEPPHAEGPAADEVDGVGADEDDRIGSSSGGSLDHATAAFSPIVAAPQATEDDVSAVPPATMALPPSVDQHP